MCACLLGRLPANAPALAEPGTSIGPAATLLGEVRAGGAAAMRFEAGGEEEQAGRQQAQQAQQDVELAKMLRLIEERRQKFEADRAVSMPQAQHGGRWQGVVVAGCQGSPWQWVHDTSQIPNVHPRSTRCCLDALIRP